VVVGVTGAVGPLGAVGTTGTGLDHAIGVAAGWSRDDEVEAEGECEVDEPAVVGVDEPVAETLGRDASPTALVVVDRTPAAVVEGDPTTPTSAGRAPCPAAGRLFEASRDGRPEPPTERTRLITNATRASAPSTTTPRDLARLDKRISAPPPKKLYL
jgi:hypothetical protein